MDEGRSLCSDEGRNAKYQRSEGGPSAGEGALRFRLEAVGKGKGEGKGQKSDVGDRKGQNRGSMDDRCAWMRGDRSQQKNQSPGFWPLASGTIDIPLNFATFWLKYNIISIFYTLSFFKYRIYETF